MRLKSRVSGTVSVEPAFRGRVPNALPCWPVDDLADPTQTGMSLRTSISLSISGDNSGSYVLHGLLPASRWFKKMSFEVSHLL